MNLMTRGNQTRHQLLSNRSRRTSHKHSHHGLLERGINNTPYDETAALAVTPPSTQHGERLLLSTLLVSCKGAHKLVEGNQPLDRRRLPRAAAATDSAPDPVARILRGDGKVAAVSECKTPVADRGGQAAGVLVMHGQPAQRSPWSAPCAVFGVR